MRPQQTGLLTVRYGCHKTGCDFEGEGKNGVGIAAQHAEATGHHVWAEQVTSMTWNADE